MTDEPSMTVCGKPLTRSQAMAVRIAVNSMLSDLLDTTYCEQLGPAADAYRARLREVLAMMAAQPAVAPLSV